jgi:catechol 2,3-dioxygenase-like lactoylglutathione lyase family enzyme
VTSVVKVTAFQLQLCRTEILYAYTLNAALNVRLLSTPEQLSSSLGPLPLIISLVRPLVSPTNCAIIEQKDLGLGEDEIMIDHTGVVVSDIETSKVFYSAALGAIGLTLLMEFPASVTGSIDVAGFGAPDTLAQGLSPEFWLAHGTPGAIPVHIAFRVSSRRLVDAFYKVALGAGGRDNGAPGLRPHYHPNYYAAFVLDPDGHNVEAVCREPA